ncbi:MULTISPECIES: DUF2934 domain-containing protein [Rhizobium]|uniref:DUF2934 domain-containing protein n=1 Tax=Rhizobium laguerreae TaxID=1076926 RepID=A0A7Y2W987_9HYPH|nr:MULTISPECIES: DUF2934 domain-containing protein [Rhizobium]MBY5454583.1 DUF2934 domain-containing protein [Rhizobium leguminosarum]NDK54218.1 DUF2934 domain-containing protein [Rhizobium laguerreae]NNH42026.1 DUF2934 domain-containing protein [Rhizobium laguerreae]NNH57236.1 DUF2934 domain-containing protein [Rhizobium laguerreae]NNH68149.1 DUF2934 domain-containing protein [Rhizobium laguerreae]
MQFNDEEQLRRRAYAIWERQGCPEGKDAEIWDLAVQEMNGQQPPQSRNVPSPPTTRPT